MSKIIIDGTNAALGRLASYCAKQALQGNEMVVLNSEKVVISGRKEEIMEKYQILIAKGGSSQKGPRISRSSDLIVKRAIRGMLPNHRFGRGREAWKRIRCFVGIPKEYEKEKLIKSGKEKHSKYIEIKELSKSLKNG